MARMLEGEEAREEAERHFRFTMEFLEGVMNGEIWHLVRGKDFPRHWPMQTLRQRMYAAAHYRGGRIRFWRIDEDTFAVQWYEKPPVVKGQFGSPSPQNTQAPTLEP